MARLESWREYLTGRTVYDLYLDQQLALSAGTTEQENDGA